MVYYYNPETDLSQAKHPRQNTDWDAKVREELKATPIAALPPPPPASTPVAATPVSSGKWALYENFEYREKSGRDGFHLHQGTDPKASIRTCLEKCGQNDNCKVVIFNELADKCWAKDKWDGLARDSPYFIEKSNRSIYLKCPSDRF